MNRNKRDEFDDFLKRIDASRIVDEAKISLCDPMYSLDFTAVELKARVDGKIEDIGSFKIIDLLEYDLDFREHAESQKKLWD
jgi:hypothetical protein